MENKIVKVNCSFCSKEIESPENMVNSEKHACFECFQKLMGEGKMQEDEMKKIHVDIPMEKMDEMMPDIVLHSLMEDFFPKFWKENKDDFKQMTKREMAEQMFASGVSMAFETVAKMNKDSEEEISESGKVSD